MLTLNRIATALVVSMCLHTRSGLAALAGMDHTLLPRMHHSPLLIDADQRFHCSPHCPALHLSVRRPMLLPALYVVLCTSLYVALCSSLCPLRTPLDTLQIIDSTWQQARAIHTDPRLKGVRCHRVMQGR